MTASTSSRAERVLVTGAGGFIGRQVVEALLAAGSEVNITTRSATGISAIVEHQVDLLNSVAVRRLMDEVRPTHLVHLAWYTEPTSYWTSNLNTEWLRASQELIQLFAGFGGERLIVGGTCAEYEWGPARLLEGVTPERPATAYGRAKLSLLNSTFEISQRTGISFAWTRLFFPFGPHERLERLLPSLIAPLLRGEVAHCRNGELERDFLYVEDVGNALASTLKTKVEGVVNIGSGKATRLSEVAMMIGILMDRLDLMHIAERDNANPQARTIVADVSRLKNEVGWEARYSLDEAVAKTVAWHASLA